MISDHEWRASVQARIAEEASARARMPDVASQRMTVSELAAAAARAGLVPVFDVEGHGPAPSDDEVYDEMERTMRADGRAEEADRFARTRPPRREPTLRDRFGSVDADPFRLGRMHRRFEIRFEREASASEVLRVQALRVFPRVRYETIASLVREGERMVGHGRWCDVAPDTVTELVAAAEALLGAAPRFVPAPWTPQPAISRGGQCARCEEPIRAHALVLAYVEESQRSHDGAFEVARLHLGCGHRVAADELASAIERYAFVRQHLGAVGTLERGTLARCDHCRKVIARDAWRLTGPHVARKLDLECALTEAREGLADALRHVEGMDDADAWRSRLST